MQFLEPNLKLKIVRTRLYGDQEFTHFELELLHTPLLQRLYELKQLGFTDRIYPDAIHSRFNHILGAVEVVDKMAKRLSSSLKGQASHDYRYVRSEQTVHITGEQLRDHLNARLPSLRMVALLHDVTHAAYGHTLEDEVNVFDEKHDDEKRQVRFFDALVAQLLYIWCTERGLHRFDGSIVQELSMLELSPGFAREQRWAQELRESLSPQQRNTLGKHLRDLEFAFRLLLQIEFAHAHHHEEPTLRELFVSTVAKIVSPEVSELDFAFNRDLFMIDLVGNTICADLLDYARRDADHAGLKVQFDDRFLRYLTVVSVDGKLSPTEQPAFRIAVQIFTGKMRYDVLSEISGILKARYLINERVLFHPTKSAAGAMLGTAVQLLGLRDVPAWMQVLGDREFLATLNALASSIQLLCSQLSSQSTNGQGKISYVKVVDQLWAADKRMATLLKMSVEWIVPESTTSHALTSNQVDSLRERAAAAQAVLWRLNSRRFPKVAYRLRTAQQSGGATDETIARKYCDPKARYALERDIEKECKLPTGSVSIHCPVRRTSMKVAAALVVGADLDKVAQLRDVGEISREGLEPYQKEIVAVEEMYKSIWQLHVFLDLAHWHKQPLVEWFLEKSLKFENDFLLREELAQDTRGLYHVLIEDSEEEFPHKLLPTIVERADATMRARGEDPSAKDPKAWLLGIIREVFSEQPGTSAERSGIQLGLPEV